MRELYNGTYSCSRCVDKNFQYKPDVQIVLPLTRVLQQFTEVLQQNEDYVVECIGGKQVKKTSQPKNLSAQAKAKYKAAVRVQKQSEQYGLDVNLIGGKVVVPNMMQHSDFQAFYGTLDDVNDFNPDIYDRKEEFTIDLIKKHFDFMSSKTKQLKRAGISTTVVKVIGDNKTVLSISKYVPNKARDEALMKWKKDEDTNPEREHYRQAAREILGEVEFYRDEDKGIGKEILIKLKNVCYVSPNTKSKCFFACLAIYAFYKNRCPVVNLYSYIQGKALQALNMLYKTLIGTEWEFSRTKLLDFRVVEMICESCKIPLYTFVDDADSSEIQEVGLMIYNNHCIVVMPKTPENEEFAKQLSYGTNSVFDVVVQPWKSNDEQLIEQEQKLEELENIEEPDEDQTKLIRKTKNTIKRLSRRIVYIIFDFEWCHDRSQLENIKDGGVLDKYPYACSYTFLGDERKSGFIKGLNCVQEFVAYLKETIECVDSEKFVLFAHNGFSADLPIIHKEMYKQGFRKDKQSLQSKMAVIAEIFNYGKVEVSFQDSMSILGKTSLKEICKTYCSEYIKQGCDHDAIKLDNWETEWENQNLENYVMNDVLSLKEAILMCDKINQEMYGFTLLGSQNILSLSSKSQKIMFHNYYDPKKYQLHALPQIFESYCREGYQGASCQNFFRGVLENVKGFSLDFNSHYPYCCTQDMATGAYRFVNYHNTLYNGQQLKLGIYQVYIRNAPIEFACLFQFYDEGKKSPFNIKQATFKCVSVEIEEAYRKGYREIYLIDGVYSENQAPVFKEFIMDHYNKRCQAKKEMKKYKKGTQEYQMLDCKQKILKDTMNGFYGKLTASSKSVQTQLTTNEALIEKLFLAGNLQSLKKMDMEISDEELGLYQFTGLLENDSFESEHTIMQKDFTNIMNGAIITAWGRIRLNRLQEAIMKLGFVLLYSDTDSVYFHAPKDMSLEDIQSGLDELAVLWTDQNEIGKCKYEVSQDIETDKIKLFETEKFKSEKAQYELETGKPYPLKYEFFDQATFLCQKTYALKSTYTGVEFLRCNGVPKWLMNDYSLEAEDRESNIKRATFNKNGRLLEYQDFQDVITKNQPLKFNVITFSTQKKFLHDVSKQLINEGRYKDGKSKSCVYTQKIVNEQTGMCLPKIYDDGSQPEFLRTIRKQDEAYLVFSTIDEILKYYSLDSEADKHEFYRYRYVTRRESDGKFLVFDGRHSFVDYFNKVIVLETKRQHHLLLSNYCQQLSADIDYDLSDIQKNRAAKNYGVKFDAQSIVKSLRKIFVLDDSVGCEVINRSRDDKISFHVRFNINYSYGTIRYCLNSSNEGLLNGGFLDTAIYKNQLRITNTTDKSLFDCNMVIQNPKLDPKRMKSLLSSQKKYSVGESKLNIKQVQLDEKNIKQSVIDQLKIKQLDKTFIYQSSYMRGRSTIVRLKHIKGAKYQCEKCNRSHENDNCIIMEISYDSKHKKQQIAIKCLKPKVIDSQKVVPVCDPKSTSDEFDEFQEDMDECLD